MKKSQLLLKNLVMQFLLSFNIDIFCVFLLLFSVKNLYFCSKELWLLMDAYFRVSAIFATCSRKLLIQRYC